MADQPKTILYEEFDGTGYTALIEVKVAAQNDTTTMSEFTSISTALGLRTDTGAVISTSIAGNVITITQSGLTNTLVQILIWGQRQ